jgi:hypothetical protein
VPVVVPSKDHQATALWTSTVWAARACAETAKARQIAARAAPVNRGGGGRIDFMTKK